MKYLIIFGIVIVLMMTLVGAVYTPPTYTNVTIVLGEEGPSNCWTKTGNVLYIPNGCVYSKLNGQVGI